MTAEPFGLKELEQPLIELPRCNRGQPESGYVCLRQKTFDQLEETDRTVSVGGNLNTCDDNFLDPSLLELAHFIDDLLTRSTALGASRQRDDAERAPHVAAVFDLDGCSRVAEPDREVGQGFERRRTLSGLRLWDASLDVV